MTNFLSPMFTHCVMIPSSCRDACLTNEYWSGLPSTNTTSTSGFSRPLIAAFRAVVASLRFRGARAAA